MELFGFEVGLSGLAGDVAVVSSEVSIGAASVFFADACESPEVAGVASLPFDAADTAPGEEFNDAWAALGVEGFEVAVVDAFAPGAGGSVTRRDFSTNKTFTRDWRLDWNFLSR